MPIVEIPNNQCEFLLPHVLRIDVFVNLAHLLCLIFTLDCQFLVQIVQPDVDFSCTVCTPPESHLPHLYHSPQWIHFACVLREN